MQRRASDRSLHSYMAGSHAVLTSAHFSGSRYAIQYETPEHEEIERRIWRKIFPDGTQEPIDFNEALEETKFGMFHICLFLACGMIYMACSASLSTLSFTLPGSTCDLKFTAKDKGEINTAPYIGMLIGTFVWGSLSDSKGRRTALMMSLGMDVLAGILSSFSVNKWMLLLCRSVNGFSIIGATSLVFAFLGEFLTENQGELLLPAIEFFYCLGMVYIPAIAWLILPLDINLGKGKLFYHSWNLFTACASIPSLTGFVIVRFFPESPKFTLLTGRLDKTLFTLQKMYHINTGKHDLPVTCLSENEEVRELLPEKVPKLVENIKQSFKDIYASHKELFKKTNGLRTILCCLIDFSFNCGYLTLIIWVPELLDRLSTYKALHNKTETSLCEASESIGAIKLFSEDCGVHNEIYLHSLIITGSCVPVVAVAFILLRYVSKKTVLSGLLTITGIASILFNFVETEVLMVLLCSIFESCATLLETLLFVSIVEIFPTHIAGTALAVTACSGRLGAILGNVFIGHTLDTHCRIPIYTFGVLFFIAAIMSLFLPTRK